MGALLKLSWKKRCSIDLSISGFDATARCLTLLEEDFLPTHQSNTMFPMCPWPIRYSSIHMYLHMYCEVLTRSFSRIMWRRLSPMAMVNTYSRNDRMPVWICMESRLALFSVALKAREMFQVDRREGWVMHARRHECSKPIYLHRYIGTCIPRTWLFRLYCSFFFFFLCFSVYQSIFGRRREGGEKPFLFSLKSPWARIPIT